MQEQQETYEEALQKSADESTSFQKTNHFRIDKDGTYSNFSPFVSKLSLPNLQWRGSTNQRIWKVKNVNEIFDITEKLSDM